MKRIRLTTLCILALILLSATGCKKEELTSPTCEITSPSKLSEFPIREKIMIKVDATLEGGEILEVSFTIDGTYRFSDEIAPYEYGWFTDNEVVGNHTIVATAKDENKNVASDTLIISIIGGLSTLETLPAVSVSGTTAVSGGEIISSGGVDIIERGICWGLTTYPDLTDNKNSAGTGTGTFSSNLSGLIPDTVYYVRAYAINSSGTAYGDTIKFATIPPGVVADIDGNEYTTVTLGMDVWMAENLKTTKYNDGSDIPHITEAGAWNSSDIGAFCYYDNNTTYMDEYGGLYNKYAFNSGKLCPTGWHVSSNKEWNTMVSYLGGEAKAGGALKETGTSHWRGPNSGATNSSGFTGLAGGEITPSGTYGSMGTYGLYWTSGSAAILDYDLSLIQWQSVSMKYGLSVRCVKD